MNNKNWTSSKWIKIALLVILLAVVSVWLMLTPAGLDGKINAIGYAICHQIESHSLKVGGRILPLCTRCTAMFMGTLIALLVLASNERASAKPSKGKMILLGAMFLLFVVDGVNSSLSLFPSLKPLYPPENLFRLLTGLMMGIILANLLVPLWNQTLWVEINQKPALQSWKQLLFLMLAEAALGILIWLDFPILYYPIAILSTGTIFLILGMVYSLLWMIILHKENTLERYKDGLTFFLFGLLTASVQIGLMDLLRYSILGTWQGFPY